MGGSWALMTKVKKRRIVVHQDIMYDIILRQAGTLSKAILEGEMNSVDAGSTTCSIGLTDTQAVIVDNGRGFRSEKEIENWFEQLGKGHEAEELEHKTYAQFRMGRGQLFAYGKNTWKTDTYRMHVDIKGRGGDYDLAVDAEPVAGCTVVVDFYEKLSPSELHDTIEDIRLWSKYMPINIYLNGELITVDPAEEAWDHVTDEGYIRLRASGNLVVYNLGAFVMEYPHYKIGTGGILVSKEQVKVNFARNDIQSDCKVWKKLKPFINQKATERNVKKKSLDDEGRRRLAIQVKTGGLDWNAARGLNLITAVTGRHYDLYRLSYLGDFATFTVAPKGNRLGDNIMKRKTAFVVAEETLFRFGVSTLEELMALLKKSANETWLKFDDTITPFNRLTVGMDDRADVLFEKDLTVIERIWLRLLNRGAECIRIDGSKVCVGYGKRKIVIGQSEVMRGWTDGRSYIAVERGELKREFTVESFGVLMHILVHEACHEEPSAVEHDHTQAFYETYHDTSEYSIGTGVKVMLKNISWAFAHENKKETKRVLKERDLDFAVTETAKKSRSLKNAVSSSQAAYDKNTETSS